MNKKLLIVEDEKSVAKQLRWGLADEYDITLAGDAEQARPLIASGAFPVITMDLGLPPFPDNPSQGLKLLEETTQLAPHSKVIVITGNAENDNAVKAVSLGATDFYAKPIDIKILKLILSRTYKIQEFENINRQLLQQSTQSGSLCGMIGISEPMTKLFERIKHASATDYPVLITGSTGTGKEVAANAVHNLSQRADKPLIIVNCGAIPENLIESELFGHEKGAFTGAASRQIGKFEKAEGGTIFLDEIGELPLSMQVKLLRTLQESTIERIGGNKTIHLNVRIIAATNRNIEEAVQNNTFREDLYYRLSVVPIHLPTLKERSEDILVLAHHFLQEEAKVVQRGSLSFSPSAITALAAHNWPGNVRELQNRVRRALGSTLENIISPMDLGLDETGESFEDQKLVTLKQARDNAEKKVIHQALALSSGNISQAAKLLETSRPTLHDLIKKHSIHIVSK